MIRLKSLLNEDVDWYIREDGDWDYPKIESSKNARDIAQLLRRSRGIFNDDETGTMLCRTVFAVVNKAANDTLSVTWTVTIS